MGPGEPRIENWRRTSLDDFAATLTGRRVVAVDGRGGSGKTSLAERLAARTGAVVVHSDDVAWNHARFDWGDLMRDGVLEPFRAGRGVHYQPLGWAPHGREGHLDVPADAPMLIIEGIGVSRRSLAPYLDFVVWVQSDPDEARRRGLARDMLQRSDLDEETAAREWEEWEVEEIPFLADDQPWERADAIVGTLSAVAHDPETEVLVAVGRR
ncbi:hypothetical protein LWF15_01035 [Kineosporia rhizophila]|uniref:uridine kinase family protein n=1 Tax=Kineosporia rhizophila TaxID=84633 RepID=UPI001E5273D6|nr:hypothetical protein [Kineosporia rhizophila]MCE0534091.1 hypothetical protein [Kineosporia rhizophila]